MQRLYHLVVIDRYGSELRIKFGQSGAIFDRRLVHFHHPERLAEQPCGDETGLARNARPIVRGSGRSPGRSGTAHGGVSPGLGGRGDRPCWFFLFPCFFELKKSRLRSGFHPRKGQGVFRHGKRFRVPRNTPCYFLAKIENPSGTDWGLHKTASLPSADRIPRLSPLGIRYSAAK